VGDVASQDLSAPHDTQYVSKVLTDSARDAAERAVAPVYVPPDPSIARTQATILTDLLQAISTIRSIDTTTVGEKKAALIAIQGLTLQPDQMDFLLGLPDARWTLVSGRSLQCAGGNNAQFRFEPRTWMLFAESGYVGQLFPD